MAGKNISMAVIRRLPKYYRYLGDLLDNDVQRISSKELSEIIGFTASQIRQDLNNFGGFGQQGYGYNIEALHTEIGKILGLDRPYNAILIGAGNLGQAIANYSGFRKAGFEIKGLFDANPKIIGLKIREFEILDSDKIEDFVKENKIDIGILCVPKNGAQELADRLVACALFARTARVVELDAGLLVADPIGAVEADVHVESRFAVDEHVARAGRSEDPA